MYLARASLKNGPENQDLLAGHKTVLVLVLVDTQQSSQRSIMLRSISRQQISPKIL